MDENRGSRFLVNRSRTCLTILTTRRSTLRSSPGRSSARLQAGFSFYRDVLVPANAPKIGENIFAVHAVLIRPKFEWLNEALLDRHAPFGILHCLPYTGLLLPDLEAIWIVPALLSI